MKSMRNPGSCFFVADLHGVAARYDTLVSLMIAEQPAALFMGGDLLPSHLSRFGGTGLSPEEFVAGRLIPDFSKTREAMGGAYPKVFLILGNDDPRSTEEEIASGAAVGLWEYVHCAKSRLGSHPVLGYACVPPTPFQLKDWERYDVSEFVDPGCTPPTMGWRTVPVPEREIRLSTMKNDLEALAGGDDLSAAIALFHAPPYNTRLDRAALDGKHVDHAPLDVHAGSIAIRGFIETKQPLVTLHGHIHESASITGSWRDTIGRTHMFTAAHDGPELALVRFDPADPSAATRELL